MAYDDYVGIIRDNANRVFYLLAGNFRGKSRRLLGREHFAPKPVHRRLKAEPGSRGRLIEKIGKNFVLIFESSTPRNYPFHTARTLEQIHQQRQCELLRLDHVPEFRE